MIEDASNEHKDETDYIASQEYICGCSNENDKLFCWEASTACSIQARESFKAGASFILSKWQEAERWRKVGEHRPAVDEHLMYSYTCLVRLESGAYAIAVYHSCGAWMEAGTEEYLDTVIEWKPIS